MGAVNSLCVSQQSERCVENHARLPKVKEFKRNLSSTFNVNEAQHNHDQLNVNTATEEELMTLPGVNRSTAQNIVEYRQKIDGFKRVEDLALVSGVGANKLESLRMEICVGKGKQTSLPGSVPCLDNAATIDSRAGQLGKRVNINRSNVFQLVKIKGIGLITAQNIVMYRDKKGPFRSVDDLLKVKGIRPAILSLIRPAICLDDNDDRQSTSADSGIGQNSHAPAIGFTIDSVSTTSDHVNQLVQMCGPLTHSSNRADMPLFSFKHEGRHVARISSWNIEQLTDDKITNPGVKEVICMTILENGLGLIGFQGIASKFALQKVCDELNNPSLPTVSKWRGHRGHWECMLSPATSKAGENREYMGYLYDTDEEISLLSSELLEKPIDSDELFSQKPFISRFKIREASVTICSVHLPISPSNDTATIADDAQATDQQSVIVRIGTALHAKLASVKDVIVMGDFGLSSDVPDFDVFRTNGYTNMLPSSLLTDISTKNMSGCRACDNLWASRKTQQLYTGNHGVIRNGLTSPWIPDGWSWGGVVSSHCPIWVEYYTDDKMEQSNPKSLDDITLDLPNSSG